MLSSLITIALPSLFAIGAVLIFLTIASLRQKNKLKKKSDRSFRWRLKGLRARHLFGFTLYFVLSIYLSNPSIGYQLVSFIVPSSLHVTELPSGAWQTNSIHPAISNILSSEETSIKSVAEYIKQKEPNPYLRIKAIHDYVASRISYDIKPYEMGIQPPQDANTVFHTRKAVCTGYANLFSALGREIGAEIKIITGKVRQDLVPESTIPLVLRLQGGSWLGHAWNAVKISGYWYLVDATWDSSSENYRYTNDYFLISPQALIASHFPDNPAWQLLPLPLSYNDFEKQPLLYPDFFANKLELISPTQYQTNVQKVAKIELKNSQNHLITADFVEEIKNSIPDRSRSQTCSLQQQIHTKITCQFPTSGNYQVRLSRIDPQLGEIENLGQLKFKAS
jgi:transglutaminase/protease-like cytokinesis protein 3